MMIKNLMLLCTFFCISTTLHASDIGDKFEEYEISMFGSVHKLKDANGVDRDFIRRTTFAIKHGTNSTIITNFKDTQDDYFDNALVVNVAYTPQNTDQALVKIPGVCGSVFQKPKNLPVVLPIHVLNGTGVLIWQNKWMQSINLTLRKNGEDEVAARVAHYEAEQASNSKKLVELKVASNIHPVRHPMDGVGNK